MLLIYLIVRIEVVHEAALWQLGWMGDLVSDPDAALKTGRYELIGGILLAAAWGLGTYRSRDELELDLVTRAVAGPFAVVTFVVIVGVITGRSGEIGRAGVAFYAAEIVALACSQLALSGATLGEVRSGGIVAVLLSATAAGVAVLLVILTVGVLLLGPIVGPPIGEALTFTLTLILTPIAWVVTSIFSALFGHLKPPEPMALPTAALGDQNAAKTAEGHPSWYDAAVVVFRVVAVVVIVGAAAALAWVALRFRRKRAAKDEAFTVTSVGSFGDDLRGLFGSMFRRGGREQSAAGHGIVRLYLEVLSRAERDARPRGPGETAAEFAPVLTTTYRAEVTNDITHAFEEARYAGRDPDDPVLQDLRERWGLVR